MLSFSLVIGILLFVVLAFIIIGVLYSRGKVATSDDFIKAKNTTGSFILTATFLASFLGVFILFTPPEAGAIGGITTILGYSIGVGSLYFGFLLISPRIRNYLPEGSTLNDYALKRYGKKMYYLTLVLSIFYMLVHIIAELTAIAQVAYQIAGIPLIYTSFLVGIGTMIYTNYGGLRASMFTDLIQVIMIILLLGVAALGVAYYSGGIENLYKQVSNNRPDLLSFKNLGGVEYGLTLCIGVFAANLFHQGYWQRVYSGKNNSEIKRSLVICIILVIPIMLITGFMGVASAGLGLGDNPSVALFSLVYSLFPEKLVILIFVLALVLVMSTLDTLLNAIVATLSIESKKISKNIKGSDSLKQARIVTSILILGISLISARGYSVLSLFLIADLICAGVFIPLFLGLFNSDISEKNAILAAILGVASGIPLFISDKLLISFILPIVVSSLISIFGILRERGKSME